MGCPDAEQMSSTVIYYPCILLAHTVQGHKGVLPGSRMKKGFGAGADLVVTGE